MWYSFTVYSLQPQQILYWGLCCAVEKSISIVKPELYIPGLATAFHIILLTLHSFIDCQDKNLYHDRPGLTFKFDTIPVYREMDGICILHVVKPVWSADSPINTRCHCYLPHHATLISLLPSSSCYFNITSTSLMMLLISLSHALSDKSFYQWLSTYLPILKHHYRYQYGSDLGAFLTFLNQSLRLHFRSVYLCATHTVFKLFSMLSHRLWSGYSPFLTISWTITRLLSFLDYLLDYHQATLLSWLSQTMTKLLFSPDCLTDYDQATLLSWLSHRLWLSYSSLLTVSHTMTRLLSSPDWQIITRLLSSPDSHRLWPS